VEIVGSQVDFITLSDDYKILSFGKSKTENIGVHNYNIILSYPDPNYPNMDIFVKTETKSTVEIVAIPTLEFEASKVE
jgi:hypothetical protein